MTPTETRHRLAVLRDRAIAAGLVSLVQRVDIQLGIAAQLAIGDLENALAADPFDAAHADIVAALDTPPATPAAISAANIAPLTPSAIQSARRQAGSLLGLTLSDGQLVQAISTSKES